jgi:CBS domain-containing protein
MAEKKIGCLPVVEGGRLVEILTENDMLRYAMAH